jgi:hypothetical protein
MPIISKRKIVIFILFAIIFLTLISPNVYAAEDLSISPSHGVAGSKIDVTFDIRNHFYDKYENQVGYEWHRDNLWEEYVFKEYKIVWNMYNEDDDEPDNWYVIGSGNVNSHGVLSAEATIPNGFIPGSHTIVAVYAYNDQDYLSWWSGTFVLDEGGIGPDPDPWPCIIATATYGGPFEPEVVYMRYVRDTLIGSSQVGKSLVDGWNSFYYLWSPQIAERISQSHMLKTTSTALLLPLFSIIQITEFQYHTLAWINPNIASFVSFSIAALLSISVYIIAPLLLLFVFVKKRGKITKITSIVKKGLKK